MKIVFVEPNLKVTSGHVFEATRSLMKYFSKRSNNIEVGFVCHQLVDDKVLAVLPKIKPLYKLSCFEEGEKEAVVESLNNVINEFGLTDSDVIVFTTAHLRDIEGVNILVGSKSTPRFVLQIHQYYPPYSDSDSILDINLNNVLAQRYIKIFGDIDPTRVAAVTTPIKALSEKITNVCHCDPTNFPVPFSPILFKDKHGLGDLIRVGFFGDGRKEKGLLEFLRLAEFLTNSEGEFGFFVQLQNPRGFSESEIKELNGLVDTLSIRKKVEIFKGPLSTQEYYSELGRCDIVCVLHHSYHYSIRLSGIAVECGMIGVPIVARKGTCVSEWIEVGKLYGETVNSGERSLLKIALIDLKKKLYDSTLTNSLQKISVLWRDEYSAENYINNYLLPLLTHEWK